MGRCSQQDQGPEKTAGRLYGIKPPHANWRALRRRRGKGNDRTHFCIESLGGRGHRAHGPVHHVTARGCSEQEEEAAAQAGPQPEYSKEFRKLAAEAQKLVNEKNWAEAVAALPAIEALPN